MEIRPVAHGEGTLLREFRLRAVRDAPEAFYLPLDEEEKATVDVWERWATSGAETADRVMFVAAEIGDWLGMAGCSLRSDGSGVLDATGMWVVPTARGRGLGELLIDAIVDWGRHRGAVRMEFAVTESNAVAIRLYRRLGFEPTGRRRRLESNSGLTGMFMTRAL
ncbi:GNAT family N-acetyltransferase [Actinophytocola sp.]|uniref:GNAT family N-acetyltransferase n=1 Tax=Actinophytocola sp. TaxID=1872138 RepID=UPI0025B8D97A|nr:GNAT family N-acetyltransferase [Actinophytocola sp.]